MRNISLFFLLFILNSKLHSQTAVFIEKNGFVYSDTSSTPAINVLTGEVVRANDLTKDTLEFKKLIDSSPSNHENSVSRPHDYIIEPKKKE